MILIKSTLAGLVQASRFLYKFWQDLSDQQNVISGKPEGFLIPAAKAIKNRLGITLIRAFMAKALDESCAALVVPASKSPYV